jgi:hypothetical protein
MKEATQQCLDQNVLNEKLSEYTEMSKEEMENLRKK